MLPTIRPASKDDPADETDEEMLGGEETDERANLLGGNLYLSNQTPQFMKNPFQSNTALYKRWKQRN